MRRKGFPKVTPEQTRRQTAATLAHLRDGSIRMARDSLEAGEWRAALTCLGKARLYDEQRAALERGEDVQPGYWGGPRPGDDPVRGG